MSLSTAKSTAKCSAPDSSKEDELEINQDICLFLTEQLEIAEYESYLRSFAHTISL